MLEPHIHTDPDEWRALLSRFPNAHPLQTIEWGAIKSRWSWEMQAIEWRQSGQSVACTLTLKRPLPRTPFSILYCPKGPIFNTNDNSLRQEVWSSLEQWARKERALMIKIDPHLTVATGESPIPDPTGSQIENELIERGWRYSPEQIQFKNTVMLDIDRPEEEILARFKQKTRYNIRLAGRKEIEIKRGTRADFETILDMYRETAERDQFLIRPDDYYLDVWRTFDSAGMCHPLIATYQDTPIAAVILIHFGEIGIYMYGASTHLERNRMPTYLLQWEAIRTAQGLGCKWYDFWGAPTVFEEQDPLWGVWRFKKGFNGIVTHTLGAYDYPVYPQLYRLFTTALPRYRALLRRLIGR